MPALGGCRDLEFYEVRRDELVSSMAGMVLARLDVSSVQAETHGMGTESSARSAALAYSRWVYASTLDWYKVADSKGQLLLTLNGIYVTVLSSVVIAYSQHLVTRHASLPFATWFLLVAAAAAAAISILSAIACLYSRLSNARLDKIRDFLTEQDAQGEVHYRPAIVHWFGTVARVDRNIGQKMLQSADEAFELSALTEQIFLLATNVLAKHRWANWGWAAAGASLLFLLASAVSAAIAT